MADPRQIKYSAVVDDSPFGAGMRRIGDALSGVQQRFAGTGRDWGNVTSAMRGQIGAVADSVRDSVSAMGGHFSGLLGALGRTSAGMLGLVAAGAALAASKAVDATARQTEATMDLARVLGTSTNEAQVWRIALEDVGAEQSDLEGAAKGMSRQLKENEKDLQAMGLQTRDAAGQLRPMNDLLVDGVGILNQHKEGADRALAAQVLFGRGVDSSSKLLLVNNETLEESRKTISALGLEVGERSVAAWKEYDAATDRAGFSIKGLVTTVGNLLMPVLTDLINVFNAAMPYAIDVARVAIGALATAFHALRNGVVIVWEVIKAFVLSLGQSLTGLGQAFWRALRGDFSGAAAAFSATAEGIKGTWGRALDNMAASSESAWSRIKGVWSGGDNAPGQAEGTRGGKGFVAPPKKDKAEKEQSRVPFWEAELAEAKVAIAEEARLRGEFREMQKIDEAAYWEALLARTDLSEKERVSIRRKAAELNLAIDKAEFEQRIATLDAEREALDKNYAARTVIAQKAYTETVARYGAESKEAQKAYAAVLAEHRKFVEQSLQLDAMRANARQEFLLGEIEYARQEAQARFQLGEITKAQLLEQEARFEEERTAIRRRALQERLALIDPERDPIAYEQVSQQIEELERQHRLRLRGIQIQAQIEAQDNPLTRVFKSAEQALDQSIQGILNRQMTLRQAMANIWAGIRQSIVAEIGKIVAAKAIAWVKERAMAIAGIGADSAKAGAGAAASQASIPFVGPILAIAAMAAIMAAVGGLSSKVPSARGGFDIPFGVNPLTQLHEQEMVLPKAESEVIRGLARGDGAGGVADRAPVQLRGFPVGDFFVALRSDLAQAVRGLERDGRLL